MPNLYSQISGENTLEAGSPEYQSQIVQGARRTLAPQYAQAVKQARQTSANRGLYSSPVGMLPEQQIGQEFRNKMFDVGQNAAVGAADQALQDKRSAIARAFALQQQQAAYDQQNKMYDREQEASGNRLWADLLGGAAGSIGGGLGTALGRRLFAPKAPTNTVPDELAPSLDWLYAGGS